MNTSTNQKKKKPGDGPNLLFQNWIKEAMENAFAKDAKSYYAYRKALSSLKKYPLLLQSGKECKILEGFGSKLCDLLDEKLMRYAEDLQLTVIEALHHGNRSLKASLSLTKTTGTATCRTNPVEIKKEVLSNQPNPISTNGNSCSPTSIEFANTTHEVTCQIMNNQHLVSEDPVLQKKIIDVIKSSKNPQGCSMCELSACLRSQEPTDPHLLLSELNKLMDKKLVQYATDSRGRFKVTDGELDFPNSLHSESEASHDGTDYTSETSLDTKSQTGYSLLKSPVHEIPDLSYKISSYPLSFTYVDEHNNPVQAQVNAEQREYILDGNKLSGYRIRCIYEDLIISGVSYRIDWSRSGCIEDDVSYTYAYLLDPNAPKFSTNPISSIISVNKVNDDNTEDLQNIKESVNVKTETTVSTNFTFKPLLKINSVHQMTGIKRSKSQESGSCVEQKKKLNRNCTTSLLPEARIKPKSPTQLQPILTHQVIQTCTSQVAEQIIDFNNHPSESSDASSLSAQPTSAVNPTNCVSMDLQTHKTSTLSSHRIIPGGSYEIILLADVRENFGSNKVRQMLPTVFQKYDIKCESRALPIGDFLWIARWRDESDSLMEAVLDQIVERKRMDDLAHSIVDGRFREQKYRLKRTGLLHPIYLIEECSMMHNQKVSYDTLIQAISNTQVIDGFQVMTTRGPEDTVDLLASLSRKLQSRTANDLYINHKGNNMHYRSPIVNAMAWCEFVKLANKSPDPTIRDVFAKHLLQIPGCSGPKITSILETYPTPSSLMDAYDKQLTVLEKEICWPI
ncbi:unnamed protein product [Heterobilharzia americana]|nr:unnamed protein product [Heterobilharzia americana]